VEGILQDRIAYGEIELNSYLFYTLHQSHAFSCAAAMTTDFSPSINLLRDEFLGAVSRIWDFIPDGR